MTIINVHTTMQSCVQAMAPGTLQVPRGQDLTLGQLCRTLVCAELSRRAYDCIPQRSAAELVYEELRFSEPLSLAANTPLTTTCEVACLDSSDVLSKEGAGLVRYGL